MFDVIQSDLDVLNEGLIGAVSSPVELVNEVGTHLVTAGGKRIRPALCLLAARGGKAFSLEKVLPLAEALELIHTASLVHDDVIDEADTRRGEPTANAKWNNQIQKQLKEPVILFCSKFIVNVIFFKEIQEALGKYCRSFILSYRLRRWNIKEF